VQCAPTDMLSALYTYGLQCRQRVCIVERPDAEGLETQIEWFCRTSTDRVRRLSCRNELARCFLSNRFLQCIEFKIVSYFHINDATTEALVAEAERKFGKCRVKAIYTETNERQGVLLTCDYLDPSPHRPHQLVILFWFGMLAISIIVLHVGYQRNHAIMNKCFAYLTNQLQNA
jgi:hypothetical protein